MSLNSPISRRSFLKIGALALGALAAAPHPSMRLADPGPLVIGIGRVTIDRIEIYKEPNLAAGRTGKLTRDTLVELLEEIDSPYGPLRNPHWYRIDQGYVHSAHLQRVDEAHLNPVVGQLSSGRALGRITVAYSNSLHADRSGTWHPTYRLYYDSQHWVAGIRKGPDGSDWYELKDERLLVKYCVPGSHVQLIKLQDFMPLSPDVPLEEKRITVSIGSQLLTAYESGKVVNQFKISSGLPQKNTPINNIPTETPLGSFHVSVKWPVRHMGDGYLTDDLSAYELPGVPWNMFFHESGYALHGAYWHDNFGVRMSHGCVNVPPAQALWLFRWTDPVYLPGNFYTQGKGTSVNIID